MERKAALDTQGHMRSPDIEYFTAERPDFSSQYNFKYALDKRLVLGQTPQYVEIKKSRDDTTRLTSTRPPALPIIRW